MPSTADVVARETAWLNSTGDGLPALSAAYGGPFQVISGYWPRVPAAMRTSLYVVRSQISEERTAHVRIMARHRLTVHALWPLNNAGGSAEADQADFDTAIDLVQRRVNLSRLVMLP